METLSEAEAIRAHTSQTLREYDESMQIIRAQQGLTHRSLAAVWEQAWQIHNVNELLRTNLLQVQVLFQDSIDRIFSRHTESVKRAREAAQELLEGKEKIDFPKFQMFQRKLDEEERVLRKDMLEIGRLLKTLFTEYRAAQESKVGYYHIAQIYQLFAVIVAVVRQEIRQKNTVDRLSEKMEEAFGRIFGEKALDQPR